MNVGKLVRLNRLFAHPSQRFCAVAVDHFIMYGEGLPEGLRTIRKTIRSIVEAKPDAVTMHKGVAQSIWNDHAGCVPFILQSTLCRIDDTTSAQIATAEDAIRLGADAIAVVVFVKGADEIHNLRTVADYVRAAAPFDLPVVSHIYPRDKANLLQISYAPEDIAWAVRCGVEAGVDIVKVPFCGDVKAYADIIAEAPIRIVTAGGPRTGSLLDTLQMAHDVVMAGSKGLVIGRNVWGQSSIPSSLQALKAVIHDMDEPEQAMKNAGLSA